MAAKKIVLVGAGSLSFAPQLVRDFVCTDDMAGSTLTLVDVNEKNLKLIGQYARVVNDAAGGLYRIEVTPDRASALGGADFVIISVEIDRWKTWPRDIAIPWRYGIHQVLGENGGPGGLAHSLRMIPVVVEICEDVKKVAPRALILNLTNPMSRICRAIQTTGLRFIGFCHGAFGTLRWVSTVLGVPMAELDAKVAGLNHFSWLVELRFKKSRKDAFPALGKRFKDDEATRLPQDEGASFPRAPFPRDV